jgi:predicted RNA-binding protein YlxR (DUF448 family)
VACRQVGQKRGLVRLVRTLEGEVVVDITGKKAGRGAYLCMTRQCWETGIIGGKVERSLKVTLSQERKDELMRLGEELSGGKNSSG